jgi:hypothetical protein
MTTNRDMVGLFAVGAPPQGVGADGLLRWCGRLFNFLDAFLRGPRFAGLTLSRVDITLPADFKAEDGMLMYAGAGTLGASTGLYLRDGGTWKLITAV